MLNNILALLKSLTATYYATSTMHTLLQCICFVYMSKFLCFIYSKTFGNVLLIDEIPQCTERDEFSYHEMMAHLPLFCHPDPKKV